MSRDSARAAEAAVVGLGAIGLPVCTNLVLGGRAVQAWNRSAARAAQAAGAGARVVESVSDIDAPVVFVVLPDMPEISEVLDSGLRDALRPGDLLVILSTVSPSAVRSLSQSLAEGHVRVVDAPVSGGDVGAQEATLTIMVGAADEDFQGCEELLRIIGRTIVHLGPVGAGAATKMANQIVVGATLAALGEALTLTRAYGLQDVPVLDVLASGLAGSRALDVKRSMFETGDFRPGGSARNQLKDLDHALATAADLDLDLHVAASVRTIYRRFVDRGCGALDHSAVALASVRTTTEETPTC